MTYWGSNFDENDFAFDGLGAGIYLLLDRMEKDANAALVNSHPEQSMLVYLHIFSQLTELYPKCTSVHFRKKKYLSMKSMFEEWYISVSQKLPNEHKDEIQYKAAQLFEKMDKQFNV